MKDIDFTGVFEIESAKGETVPDPAAPEETDDHTEGATEQDPAAPAAEETDDESGEKKEADESGEGDKGQSAEENAAYAAARRKAEKERDEALAEAKAAKAKAVDDAIMSMGVVNPYTNKQITNKAELDAYQAQLKEEEENSLREELKNKGVADDELQKFIDHHPDVIKARKEALELETLRKKEQSAANERTIMESVEKIIKDDPSIKGPQDILNHPNFEQIKEKMDRGYSLEDAYFVVNREAIAAEKVKRAEQAAINKANSKNHLQGTRVEGKGGVQITAERMQEFRDMTGLPDAKIKAWLAKNHPEAAK